MTAPRDRGADLCGPVPVCRHADLQPDRGVAALLPGGEQAAVFLLTGGALHAVANIDPFSGAAVLSRGVVGDRGGVPVVVSPVYRHAFDLRSGVCLTRRDVSVRVYRVEHAGELVWVDPS